MYTSHFARLLFHVVLVIFAADSAQAAPSDAWQSTKRWYKVDAPTWKVALRYQPFGDHLPENFRVRQVDEKTILRKAGGSAVFHVCPDVPLQLNERIRIVYSLTESGRGGGTPVPYFGLRDSTGQECVLFLFSSFPKAEEVHEIVVERVESGFRARQDKRGIDGVGRDLRKLSDPLYVFFHMNDTSEVIIHELAVTMRPDPLVPRHRLAAQRRCRLRNRHFACYVEGIELHCVHFQRAECLQGGTPRFPIHKPAPTSAPVGQAGRLHPREA